MGFFGPSKTGGIMNVIRCDLPEYLVWKWRPEGNEANSTKRENAIRWGSSLRVKDGEVAVFVYKQSGGQPMQDFIVGPYDEIIKTANFPVLASIVGRAFGGGSPFQAEVYFINLAQIIQLHFRVPYFDVQDPRFPDLPIPVSVGSTITFKIDNYQDFIKLNRLIDFSLDSFKKQISSAVSRRVKGALTNILYQTNCPLVQIERNIDPISDLMKDRMEADLKEFGVVLRRFDINEIEPDKEHPNWQKLQQVTADYAIRSTATNQENVIRTTNAQADLNIKNMEDMQQMNSENLRESMRINREESQYAQHLTSQEQHMGAYGTTLQADVLKTAAQSMGQMGQMGDGNGGFNPAAMMTGMAVGGAMGQQMAQMTSTMGQQFNAGTMPGVPGAQQAAPVAFMVAINGQASGPYNMLQLQQLVTMGQLTAMSNVWRQGMPAWAPAGQVPELAILFQGAAPAGMPPVPGAPQGMPPVPPQP